MLNNNNRAERDIALPKRIGGEERKSLMDVQS
jgi:hypothetical protein